MEAVPKVIPIGSSFFYVLLTILIAGIVLFMSYMITSRWNTIPSGRWEGFQGPSLGVSDISCGQESSHAIAISELFSKKKSTTGSGKEDLAELKLILSKLCCVKHDLVSPSQVISSTLNVPYQNSHDRENPAELVARCFTKSVPIRDLDISFGTWKERGDALLRTLCTSYNLSNAESDRVRNHFTACWMDTFVVAKQVCTVPEGKESVNPRDLKGLAPESISNHGKYNGYY